MQFFNKRPYLIVILWQPDNPKGRTTIVIRLTHVARKPLDLTGYSKSTNAMCVGAPFSGSHCVNLKNRTSNNDEPLSLIRNNLESRSDRQYNPPTYFISWQNALR